jgi:hypothetical protein
VVTQFGGATWQCEQRFQIVPSTSMQYQLISRQVTARATNSEANRLKGQPIVYTPDCLHPVAATSSAAAKKHVSDARTSPFPTPKSQTAVCVDDEPSSDPKLGPETPLTKRCHIRWVLGANLKLVGRQLLKRRPRSAKNRGLSTVSRVDEFTTALGVGDSTSSGFRRRAITESTVRARWR